MKTRTFAHRDGQRPRQAFTLIEVLIATIITVVMFISFYSAICAGITATQVSRENLRATQILVNQMEIIRMLSWTQLTNTAMLPTNFTQVYFPTGPTNQQGITYTGTVSVLPLALQNPASSYSNNMFQINVGLTWKSGNVLRTRTQVAYYAKYGIQNYVWSSN